MRVVDLRAELGSRGLSKKGLKKELQARLTKALEFKQKTEQPAPSGGRRRKRGSAALQRPLPEAPSENSRPKKQKTANFAAVKQEPSEVSLQLRISIITQLAHLKVLHLKKYTCTCLTVSTSTLQIFNDSEKSGAHPVSILGFDGNHWLRGHSRRE